MKIGIAGPVSLKMLAPYVRQIDIIPDGYLFAPMATWIIEWINRGYQVSVFTSAPEINQPISFTGDQLNIHVGRRRSRGRAWDFFALERHDLQEAMLKNPVDILHAHWTYEFALAALNSHIPTVVTAHDAPLSILRIHPDPYRLVRAFMALRVCQCAPIISAVSPYVAEHFIKFFRYTGSLHIIPNGIQSYIFNLNQQSKKVKQNSKVIFTSILIGWAGHKNGQVLVQAFAKVHQAVPATELWMFGKEHGPGEAAQQWADERGISQGIRFFGQTPYKQMLEQLAQHVDVLVHPSLEESFSMAIAEAMALGIPVIGGKNSGAVPHTLGTGGLLVDVRSTHEMGEAMLLLGTNDKLRHILGNAGAQIAQEHYTLPKVMDQYLKLYQQIMGAVS